MNLRKQSAERLSRWCLYAVITLTAVVYLLFLFVGFDSPSPLDPSFAAPLLTSLLIIFVEMVVLVALGVVVWMGVAQWRRGSQSTQVNGISVRRIGWMVAGFTLGLMLLALTCSSASPLQVNGVRYAHTAWLRVADMFIYGGSALVLVAVGAVIYSASRSRRHRQS